VVTANGLPKSDRRGGTIKTTRTTKLAPPQPSKGIFQLQAYRVLSHPAECLKALIDPNMVGLFKRIMRGGQDCALCQTSLNLDPTSDSSPGLMGFCAAILAKMSTRSAWLHASPAR
jgi:hypothetical protein